MQKYNKNAYNIDNFINLFLVVIFCHKRERDAQYTVCSRSGTLRLDFISYMILHTSHFIFHTSHFILHTSHLTLQMSFREKTSFILTPFSVIWTLQHSFCASCSKNKVMFSATAFAKICSFSCIVISGRIS